MDSRYQLIRKKPGARVSRGTWYRDGIEHRVVAKELDGTLADARSVGRWSHEAKVLERLGGRGAPEFLALEVIRGTHRILVRDDGGESLRDRLDRGPLDLTETLELAIRIAQALGHVHAAGVVHKDLNPANILLYGDDGRSVKLIDFGISNILSRERAKLEAPSALEGTLPYMSPEQTGRTSRSVDHRTDFYALGVTLYELSTGKLPFDSTDLLELIHGHLALPPPSPRSLAPGLPPLVSDLILTLMAKSAEDRYQTASGLVHDLEICLASVRGETVPAGFEPRRRDIESRFTIPQKLYGREEALRKVDESFGAAARGAVAVLELAGPSGSGKTAVMAEVHRPLSAQGGDLLRGKLDQFGAKRPYGPVLDALGGWVRQVLGGPPEQRAHTTAELQAALDGNAPLLVDAIPGLEELLGRCPPVPALGPHETQERFIDACLGLLSALAGDGRPLVLFIDDIQWADLGTLELLRAMVGSDELSHLLLIVAYRDNELVEGHPSHTWIQKLGGSHCFRAQLGPLPLPALEQLLCDATRLSRAEVAPLARMVFDKTAGNPFFCKELLDSLARRDILKLDPERAQFVWDRSALEKVPMSDDVIELLQARLSELEPETSRCLGLAAFIGGQLSLDVLSEVSTLSAETVMAQLWPALEAGLLRPEGDTYKHLEPGDSGAAVQLSFAHDRIRQAARNVIPAEEHVETHHRVGVALAELSESSLFDAVSHLSEARSVLVAEGRGEWLRALAWRAFEAATSAHAFALALGYADLVLDLSRADAWESDFERTFEATLGRAQCAYLLEDVEAAEASFHDALVHARNPLERSKVRSQMELVYLARGEHQRVIDSALTALSELGFEVPSLDDLEAMGRSSEQLWSGASPAIERGFQSIVDLDEATDPVALQAQSHLHHMAPSAYFRCLPLYVWDGAQSLSLTLSAGRCPEGTFNLGVAGLGRLSKGDLDAAVALSAAAVKISESYPLAIRAATHFHSCLINGWKRHFRLDEERAALSYAYSVESWNVLFISWAAYAHSRARVLLGRPLGETETRARSYLRAVAKRNPENASFQEGYAQMAACLRGATRGPASYDDEAFDEAAYVERLKGYQNVAPALSYYTFKALVCFVHGCLDEAEQTLEDATPYVSPKWIEVTELYFVQGLVAAARCAFGSAESDPGAVERLRGMAEKMRVHATVNPHNFECRALLLEAEDARVRGEAWAAVQAYERAAERAAEEGFVQIEALTQERAAYFWREQGRAPYAELHRRRALEAYRRWGANRKVAALENDSEEPTPVEQPSSTHATIGQTTIRSASDVDLASMLKASQAISSEVVLDRLLERLLSVLVENAGAGRGLLLLCEDLISEDPSWQVAHELSGGASLRRSVGLKEFPEICHSVVREVIRTKAPVHVDDANHDARFAGDEYLRGGTRRSILAMPVRHHGCMTAIIYLENDLAESAFSSAHLQALSVLSGQVAISIENARVYSSLEARVSERTSELEEKNAQMVTVLDNIAEGLVLVDRSGWLGSGRSAVFDRWFAGGEPTRIEALFARDPAASEWLELAWGGIEEQMMPLSVCLTQLPTEVCSGERSLELTWKPLAARDHGPEILLIASDVSERRRASALKRRQEQLLELVDRVSRDRSGIVELVKETDRLLVRLADNEDATLDNRIVHTIKGNCALYGLTVVSNACHELEGHLQETGRAAHPSERTALSDLWKETRADITRLVNADDDGLRVPRVSFETLLRRMEQAQSRFATELAVWGLESAESRLQRLADQTAHLAQRLGKAPLEMIVDDEGIWMDPGRWQAFFSAFVHVMRNAVDHGLETAAERKKLGKGPARIGLSAEVVDGVLLIECADDGRGIDWARVRAKALSAGLPADTEGDLLAALLTDGVSTRDTATQTSGRGVGMAALAEICREMGGHIELRSELGAGTTWTFRFPAALVTQWAPEEADLEVRAV